ncbi:hypothetical protein ID866_961 [Astraeus odoratus]|nr:hypothetical protein ID866_961 [Astraeus odoratus]
MDMKDAARCVAMDAQRFDPMRRASKLLRLTPNTPKENMGQVLCKPLRTSKQIDDAVGGVWEDHELVFVPIEAYSPTETLSYADSDSSWSNSLSTSISTFIPPPPSSISNDTVNAGQPCSRHIEVYDRDDLIITRTTIRPAPVSQLTGRFTRPSIPIPSRPLSPFLRPLSPLLKAISCLSASVFGGHLDDTQAREPKETTKEPVLQVIVMQTREQYEHDMAFKEAVQEIHPESFSGRGRV